MSSKADPAGENRPPSVQRVVDAAKQHNLDISVVEYPEETRTAEQAATAVGCAVDQIVKSMIFDADGEVVLALTSGANQVDTTILAELTGASSCGRADPEQVRAITGFAIGGVAPLGHQQPVRSWIDAHLLSFDEVWAAAGTPRHVFPINPKLLAELTGATTAAFGA